MNVEMLALTLWLAATSNSAAVDSDCERYVQVMRSPEAIALLEAWRARLPSVFDRKKYPRVWESSGFGGYSFALDFDPALLGLGAKAHAEVSVDPKNGTVQLAAISDAQWTGFVFRFDGFEYRFEKLAMKSPRSAHVGVACRIPRGE